MLTEQVVRTAVKDEVEKVLQARQARVPTPGTPSHFSSVQAEPPSPKLAQMDLEQKIATKQFNTAFKQV